METVYFELNAENLLNCAIWCSVTTHQELNSSIIFKGAMNFKKMFPLARMFPLAVIHRGSKKQCDHHSYLRCSNSLYTISVDTISFAYYWFFIPDSTELGIYEFFWLLYHCLMINNYSYSFLFVLDIIFQQIVFWF